MDADHPLSRVLVPRLSTLKAHSSTAKLATKLIVLDTLARCSVGVDENSAKEMGTVIDAVIRIRAETGATVLLVHHTGKDTSRGMRGSNRLLGDLDTTIEVVRNGADYRVALHVRKQKDSAEGNPIEFEMRKVEIPATKDWPATSSLAPVRTTPKRSSVTTGDALWIAEKLPVGEVTTLSKTIGLFGLKRGQHSYDRIKNAVPAVTGITVQTPMGLRRITRVEDGSKHGALLAETA